LPILKKIKGRAESLPHAFMHWTAASLVSALFPARAGVVATDFRAGADGFGFSTTTAASIPNKKGPKRFASSL
jgi:hypothetical protein